MMKVRNVHACRSSMCLFMVLGACASSPHIVNAPREKRADHFRPEWTASIPLRMDEVRACVDGRQRPVGVVHLQELATGDTGVTAVDGSGSLENCAARGSHVVMRGPSQFQPEDMIGLPLFVPGSEVPQVSAGIVLEEVDALDGKDEVLGWLYWPKPRQAPLGTNGNAGVQQ